MSAVKFIRVAVSFFSLISFTLVTNADNQPNRPFNIHKLEEVGLEVWVPANPKWELGIDERTTSNAVILKTPPLYYPTTAIEIVFNEKITISESDLLDVATAALKEIRRAVKVEAKDTGQKLTRVKFGDIDAYQDQFGVTFEGKSYSMQTFMGVFPSGQTVTMLVTTPVGQINHISVVRDKIFKKLSVLP